MSNKQQFKVGDFVIEKYDKTIHKVLDLFPDVVRVYGYSLNNTYSTEYEDFIKWQPQSGELCWFTNNKDSKSAVLCKFNSYEEEKIVFKFKNIRNKSFAYCEPFLNSKPSWFKD